MMIILYCCLNSVTYLDLYRDVLYQCLNRVSMCLLVRLHVYRRSTVYVILSLKRFDVLSHLEWRLDLLVIIHFFINFRVVLIFWFEVNKTLCIDILYDSNEEAHQWLKNSAWFSDAIYTSITDMAHSTQRLHQHNKSWLFNPGPESRVGFQTIRTTIFALCPLFEYIPEFRCGIFGLYAE